MEAKRAGATTLGQKLAKSGAPDPALAIWWKERPRELFLLSTPSATSVTEPGTVAGPLLTLYMR